MKKPSIVLFDLGNVLVRYTPQSFWKVLEIGENEQVRYRHGVVEAVTRFETGRISTEQYFGELQNVFLGIFSNDQLRQATASVLTDPIPGMEEIVRKVSEKTNVALVSNTNEFHYAYCLKATPALKYITKHFLSFRMGVMKPGPDFYERVVVDLRIEPETAIFIDDVHENVEGAKKRGMQGVLFKKPETLRIQLNELNLLRND